MLITRYERLTVEQLLKEYSLVIVFDTIIAFLLWTIMPDKESFIWFFILAQFIGLSISTVGNILFQLFKPATTSSQIFLHIISLFMGITTALFLFSFFFDTRIINYFYSVLSVAFIFGVIITYFFIAREKYSQLQIAKQEEELKRISLEKENIQANLKLLQAQIEPHFLFNTLSTVLSLLDTDIKTGRNMLENLTQYLRTSLKHTRNETNTLKQEMETIQSYLDINKIRMGDRLNFKIEIPNDLYNIPFPPMLIQPLIENAVKHGIEPKITGGTISIKISEKVPGAISDKEKILKVEIADTGTGIDSDLSSGIGLDNVKKRLKALYQDKSFITFEDNKPSGLKVTIGVPYEKTDSNNS
ncbi:MAG: histidine kinase [Desulfobacteraceae bacterium]|nr:histidine kinase [Desulfobacteraceae bacterium]